MTLNPFQHMKRLARFMAPDAKPLGLTAKLFIAMVAVNILIIGAMAVGARLSFEHGFLGYLEQEDIKRLEASTAPLAAAYRDHGSWDFLEKDHHLWHELVRPYANPYRQTPLNPPYPPPPLADLVGANLRFSLLDANGKFVVGNPSILGRTPRRAIIAEGKTVGWLLIVPIQRVTETGDLRLQQSERDAGSMLAVIAMLLAVVISLWLARALGLPLQRIARATHMLAGGKLDVRVTENSAGELGQLEADFNHLARSLQANEQMRAALVADVSHELRTPLAVMRGEVEALEVGIRPLSTEAMRSLSVELERLGRLVDDLYHLSLSDTGALPYYHAEIDIAEALVEVVQSVRGHLADAGITLHTAIPDAPCWVFGDERRLQQVFSNLFQNVLRYVPAGAQVDVTLTTDAKDVHIDIQDSGAGVPEDALPALFGRFYRVEGSRSRATGGAGLGLPICRSIMEAHQGSITAAKAPQGGLWMAIAMPRLDQSKGNT